jgi:hypothetical protein
MNNNASKSYRFNSKISKLFSDEELKLIFDKCLAYAFDEDGHIKDIVIMNPNNYERVDIFTDYGEALSLDHALIRRASKPGYLTPKEFLTWLKTCKKS